MTIGHVAAFLLGIAACWIGFWLVSIRDFLPGLWRDISHKWRNE